MRIYEGATRQNYEAVLRSIGAMLDQRGMREITLAETDDGFMVQGLAVAPGDDRPWTDPAARLEKETFHLGEDDIARFMDESVARRQGRSPLPPLLAGKRPASTRKRCASSAATSINSIRETSSSSSRTTSS